MDDIDELARKAIEAEAAMKNENSLSPKYALKLRLDAHRKEFQDATTPAAWLKRSERIAELEAALKEAREALELALNTIEARPDVRQLFGITEGHMLDVVSAALVKARTLSSKLTGRGREDGN
jgi:hypothetical protein